MFNKNPRTCTAKCLVKFSHDNSMGILTKKTCDLHIPRFVQPDFPGGSDGKASVYNVGDLGLIPGSGSSLEKEMATHSSTLA